MKAFSLSFLLFLWVVAGCAHTSDPAVSSVKTVAPPPMAKQTASVAPSAPVPRESAAVSTGSANSAVDEYGDIEVTETTAKPTTGEIADPLEPFNRAMYHFNDKLYFWLLKPVAQGYTKVIPEPARVSVKNFFTNLAFPVRFVNCLLQANFKGAATELGRFTVNTFWGVGGFLDPASDKQIDLPEQEEDLGQTLGVYGLGQGFFITWPFFGPSTPRDTVGLVGDAFLSPPSYLSPWYAAAGMRFYDRVNDTSLRIGDYEALKAAAIDPYVAIRNAYVQYRLQAVRRKGGNAATQEPGVPK